MENGNEVQIEMSLERLQRIVQLKVANVPDWQIGKAYNLSEDVLAELYKTEEYQKEFSKYFEKQMGDLAAVNEGWDGLEKRALLRLHETLTTSFVDPDFALKVAVMANKAARRPLVGNRPIDAAQGGTAVIYITNNFVEKMQSLRVTPRDHNQDGGEKKQTDFIDPNRVEDILLEGKQIGKSTEDEILDLFSEPIKLLREDKVA